MRCRLPILPKLLRRLMTLLVCEFFVELSVCLSIALIRSDLAVVVSEAHSPTTADPIVEEHAPEAPQTSAKPLQTSDAEAIPTSEEGPVEGSKLQEEETNLETASISGASEVSSHPALSVSMPESRNAIATLVETTISTNQHIIRWTLMSNTTLLTTMIPQSKMRACCESGLGFDMTENRFDNTFYYSTTSTSVRSSVYQFVQENGRTYHKYREGSKSSLYVQSLILLLICIRILST
jgi:hypothetical protein